MRKSPKPGLWLVLTAVVALIGAGGMYMQVGSLGEKKAEYEKVKAQVKRPAQVQIELEQKEKDVQEAQQRLDHLERAVPAFAYVPTLLKELETFGEQHGLDVFGVRPMPKQESTKDKDKAKKDKKKEPYIELAIEVKGRGTYQAVASFVKDLQTFPKIVAARAISLSPKNDPGLGKGVIEMTIELKTYLFRPSKDELDALADEFKKNSEQGSPASSSPLQTTQPPTGASSPARGVQTHGQQ